jgi:catechol O-methyltransferase
LKQELK